MQKHSGIVIGVALGATLGFGISVVVSFERLGVAAMVASSAIAGGGVPLATRRLVEADWEDELPEATPDEQSAFEFCYGTEPDEQLKRQIAYHAALGQWSKVRELREAIAALNQQPAAVSTTSTLPPPPEPADDDMQPAVVQVEVPIKEPPVPPADSEVTENLWDDDEKDEFLEFFE